MNDQFYIEKALALAAKGRGRTSPNPMVGAVIVKHNKVIAQGYHKKAGTAHAEIVALKKAGADAKDATLYVSLEPCCHTGKKTPPCTNAIITAGIKHVVIAMKDPNPKVSGKGITALRKAGITVRSGIMKTEAEKLNETFSKYITTREPFVLLKIAQSLDGKIATAKGESKWITGAFARKYVHKLRNDYDGLLIGSGTLLKDNPSLDCRARGGVDPFRIIVDTSLKTPLNSKALKFTDNKTIIATTKKADTGKIIKLEALGVSVLILKEKAGQVDLRHLMKELGRLNITSVMIEGGSSIAASALSCGIVDKVMFFIAPKIIGGADSISSIGGRSPALLKNAIQLKHFQATAYGDDILMEAYLK